MLIPTAQNELDSRSRLAMAIKRADEQRKDAEATAKTLAAWEAKQKDLADIIQRGPVSPVAVESFVLAKLTVDETTAQVEKVKREFNKSAAMASHLESEVDRAWAELSESGDKIKSLSAAVSAVENTGDNLAIHRVKSQLASAQSKVDSWLAVVG